MSERLTRQELKDDPLLRETAHAAEFASKHSRLLVGAAVVLVVGVLGYFFIRGSAQRAEDRAADQLTRALVDVEQGNLPVAAQRLEDVLNTSAGTDSGRQAILVLGDIRYALGTYDEAEKLYRQAVDVFGKGDLQGRVARQGLAASLENLGRNDEAATLFRELADGAGSVLVKSDFLLSAARNYVRAGKAGDAEAAYQSIIGDATMPQRAIDDAELRLAQLKRTGTSG